MLHQFYELPLRLLQEVACGDVLQLQAQRQCVDEQAQHLLRTGATVEATKQHRAAYDVVTTARVRDHKRPSGVEERGDAHSSQSGTRSAARIVAGSMRSATTAHLSPSTMTSGTSARLL